MYNDSHMCSQNRKVSILTAAFIKYTKMTMQYWGKHYSIIHCNCTLKMQNYLKTQVTEHNIHLHVSTEWRCNISVDPKWPQSVICKYAIIHWKCDKQTQCMSCCYWGLIPLLHTITKVWMIPFAVHTPAESPNASQWARRPQNCPSTPN